MTVPGMKKIFSAVAMTAAVVTLTLASADVLASGKGNNGKGSSKETSSQTTSSSKAKGHDHNNNGKGHQHDHPGYINGVGHHKHHDHDDDDDDGSCEAPDDDHDSNGKGKGHDNHKGKGHQHDHPGYINGVGHHKHHDHDDDDDCGGGGDNGGGVVLPEGCFVAAGYVVYRLESIYDDFTTSLFDEIGVVVGDFGIGSYSNTNTTALSVSSSVPGTELRKVNLYLGSIESYTDGMPLDNYFTAQPTNDSSGGISEFSLESPGTLVGDTEAVAEVVICEVTSDDIAN